MAAGSLSPVAEIAGHTPLAAKIMRPIVRRLSRPGILVWAAPIRALRERCGWRPRPVALSEARSILVIRPDEIGDVVLTSPFLRELRQSAPQARITLLVKPGCYGLVEYCPHVDAVLPFEFGSGGRLPWRVWRFRYRELPWRGFDLVLLPRYDTDWYNSEFVAHCLAGRGCVLAHRKLLPDRVPAWRSLRIYSNPRVEHEAVHPLSFLRWCGGAQIGGTHLEVWPAQEDEAFAARRCRRRGSMSRSPPVHAAGLGAGRPSGLPRSRFGCGSSSN